MENKDEEYKPYPRFRRRLYYASLRTVSIGICGGGLKEEKKLLKKGRRLLRFSYRYTQHQKHPSKKKKAIEPKHCHVDVLFSRTREVLRASCAITSRKKLIWREYVQQYVSVRLLQHQIL